MLPGGPEGREDWLRQCFESVAGQGTHISYESEFLAGRAHLYRMGGVVACLDWDDRLMPGAVAACEQALAETRAGLAFTWQRRIDASGARIGDDCQPITRLHCSSEPNSIHHLVCIRSELVPAGLIDLIEKIAPMCIDWIVKAFVALKYGAVQVPMIGYEWRQHQEQTSRKYWKEYREQVPLARALIRTWLPSDISQTRAFPIWGGEIQ
jgi:hypothetical protein